MGEWQYWSASGGVVCRSGAGGQKGADCASNRCRRPLGARTAVTIRFGSQNGHRTPFSSVSRAAMLIKYDGRGRERGGIEPYGHGTAREENRTDAAGPAALDHRRTVFRAGHQHVDGVPILYFIKYDLGLGEAGGQLFDALRQSGWFVKPLWGLISERCRCWARTANPGTCSWHCWPRCSIP